MKKRPKTTAKTTVRKTPQPHGGALNAGGTPGNRGGGRPPDEYRKLLSEIRDEQGLPVLIKSLAGALAKSSADTQLRALELLHRHTLPQQREVRLVGGVEGTAAAYQCIKSCLRARLAPDVASDLITDIEEALAAL